MRQSIFGVLVLCLFAATYVSAAPVAQSAERLDMIDDFNFNEVDRNLDQVTLMSYTSFEEPFAASGTYYSEVGFADSDRRAWIFEHYRNGQTETGPFIASAMQLYIDVESGIGNRTIYHSSSATDGAGFQNTLIWAGVSDTPYECATQNELFCVPAPDYLDDFTRPYNKQEFEVNFAPLSSNAVYIPAGQPIDYASNIWVDGDSATCSATKFGTWGASRCDDSCLVKENAFEQAVWCNPSFTQRQNCLDVDGDTAWALSEDQTSFGLNPDFDGPAPYDKVCSTGWCEVPFANDPVAHVPFCSDLDAYVAAGFHDNRTDFEDWTDRDSINFIYSADLEWTKQVYIYSSPTQYSVSIDPTPLFGVGRVFTRMTFADFTPGPNGPADFSNVGVVVFRYQTESSLDLALITMYAERVVDACKYSSVVNGTSLSNAPQQVDFWITVDTVGTELTLELFEVAGTIEAKNGQEENDTSNQVYVVTVHDSWEVTGPALVSYVASSAGEVLGVEPDVNFVGGANSGSIDWVDVPLPVPSNYDAAGSFFSSGEILDIINSHTFNFSYSLNYALPGCVDYSIINSAQIITPYYTLELEPIQHFVQGITPVYQIDCIYDTDIDALVTGQRVTVTVQATHSSGGVSGLSGYIELPSFASPNPGTSQDCNTTHCFFDFGELSSFELEDFVLIMDSGVDCEGLVSPLIITYDDDCFQGDSRSDDFILNSRASVTYASTSVSNLGGIDVGDVVTITHCYDVLDAAEQLLFGSVTVGGICSEVEASNDLVDAFCTGDFDEWTCHYESVATDPSGGFETFCFALDCTTFGPECEFDVDPLGYTESSALLLSSDESFECDNGGSPRTDIPAECAPTPSPSPSQSPSESPTPSPTPAPTPKCQWIHEDEECEDDSDDAWLGMDNMAYEDHNPFGGQIFGPC